MPLKLKKSPTKTMEKTEGQRSIANEVDAVISSLKRLGTKKTRDDMASRYGIHIPNPDKAFGVPVGKIRDLGKSLGRSHELAAALWVAGWYEARMLCAFVDEPDRVSPAQMDRWCRDFDNWAICDHLCFHLFDRTPHAFQKVAQWSGKREEFVKRAAFALLWGLTVHDKRAGDECYLECLPLIERAATDERNFVKKAVSMALRAIGKRNRVLHAAAATLAHRLADSPHAAARWVGKDALRDLAGPAATRRLAKQRRTAPSH